MVVEASLSSLLADGYCIIDIEDLTLVDQYKSHLLNTLHSLSAHPNASFSLDEAHLHLGISSDDKANSIVLELIRQSSDYSFSEIVFNSNQSFLKGIFGSDIHAQRHNNLVFQYPRSNRYSEVHTDAPANSFFELVSWLPLVDCYSTKSFYIVNRTESLRLLGDYKLGRFDFSVLRQKAIEAATHVTVPYGRALFFWTGLLHGSLINDTNESRWCLNARFKNLFAPSGLHDPLTFYRILSISPISDMAFSVNSLA